MYRDQLTYRYPRTLIEAFGCDAETATAVHGPYKKPQDFKELLAIVLVLSAVLAVGHFV